MQYGEEREGGDQYRGDYQTIYWSQLKPYKILHLVVEIGDNIIYNIQSISICIYKNIQHIILKKMKECGAKSLEFSKVTVCWKYQRSANQLKLQFYTNNVSHIPV